VGRRLFARHAGSSPRQAARGHADPGDLREAWPAELAGPFDRIVSTYVLHEFSLEHKVALLRHLADCCLAPEGRIVIGDIAFESVQARTDASADQWDEEEHYWAADETRAACASTGMALTYTQVSSCGGVYVFTQFVGE
jgi:hypothetical protein